MTTRNIFALTSYREPEMDVISATNGRNAIDLIEHADRTRAWEHDAGNGWLQTIRKFENPNLVRPDLPSQQKP
jgi:hypothetical protein